MQLYRYIFKRSENIAWVKFDRSIPYDLFNGKCPGRFITSAIYLGGRDTLNNLLHFHGGSGVVTMMSGGGQLVQRPNNSALVNDIDFTVSNQCFSNFRRTRRVTVSVVYVPWFISSWAVKTVICWINDYRKGVFI